MSETISTPVSKQAFQHKSSAAVNFMKGDVKGERRAMTVSDTISTDGISTHYHTEGVQHLHPWKAT